MKRSKLITELLFHFISTATVLIFYSLLNFSSLISLQLQEILLLLLGALVGIFLPDLDHFIYSFYLRPHEVSSKRVREKLQKRQYIESVRLMYETRSERVGLVFHSWYFMVIFFCFALFTLSSSSNLFGRFLVLSFLLHLLVDQYIDFRFTMTYMRWMKGLPINITSDHMRVFLLLQIISYIILLLAY